MNITPNFKTFVFGLSCLVALSFLLEAAPEKRALGFKPDTFGLCYGPYREGQRPDGKAPSKADMREDVRLLSKCGDAIRVYGSGHFAAKLFEVLEEENSRLKVMLGGWLGQEAVYDTEGKKVKDKPDTRVANKREIDTLIELANRFPKRIAAVCVGNETQVYWSGHRMHPDTLTGWIRYVRSKVKQPVGTADDYNFWNKTESKVISDELDFLVTHLYALWNGQKIEKALDWTIQQYKEAGALHSGVPVVVGEIGWATNKADEGLQLELMKGEAGVEQQWDFLRSIKPWAAKNNILIFYFEAFDEPWKGDANPVGAEKHWGLFKSDRSPKAAGEWLMNER